MFKRALVVIILCFSFLNGFGRCGREISKDGGVGFGPTSLEMQVVKRLFGDDKVNSTVSESQDASLKEVSRKKGASSEGPSLAERVLPIMVIPFLVSSAIIPKLLLSLKILLIKSAIVGKMALILLIMSFLRRRISGGGVYDHYPHYDMASEHYGYYGGEEYGAYVNRRKRK